MIRKLLLVWLLLHSSLHTSAQSHVDIDSTRHFICSYYGGSVSGEIHTFRSAAEPVDIIGKIVGVIGLRQNFEVRAADVPNAAAVVFRGRRLILYNPKFISAINNASGTDWAGISILAHEIGHHLNGHTLTGSGSRPDIELEADEFSGFVLRKLGASLKDAQSAMSVAASSRASHTHPARHARLKAIQNGWQNADGQMTGTTTPLPTNKTIEQPASEPPQQSDLTVLDEKYIAYSVVFTADPGGKYFVTIRNNLVRVYDNELYVAGRLAQSNKRGYRYMFYDKNFNYLYITSSGNIVNGNGKKVGSMRSFKKSND